MSALDPERPESSGEQEKPAWRMFAGRGGQDGGFSDFFTHPLLIRMNGYSGEIIPVQLTEDPEGPYWGWLPADEDVPCLIQPHETMYSIQFPYGPERAEADGSGRTIRLAVQELKLVDPR